MAETTGKTCGECYFHRAPIHGLGIMEACGRTEAPTTATSTCDSWRHRLDIRTECLDCGSEYPTLPHWHEDAGGCPYCGGIWDKNNPPDWVTFMPDGSRRLRMPETTQTK